MTKDKINLKEIRMTRWEEIGFQISHLLRRCGLVRPSNQDIISTAFLAIFIHKADGFIEENEMEIIQEAVDRSIEDLTLKGYLLNFLQKYWFPVWSAAHSYPLEALQGVVFFYNERERNELPNIPDGVMSLARKVADIQPEDVVIDFTAGDGRFLLKLASHTLPKKMYAVSQTKEVPLVLQMRELASEGILTIYQDDWSNLKGTKLFCWLPSSTRYEETQPIYPSLVEKRVRKSPIERADWESLTRILQCQEKNGLTVALLPKAALSSRLTKDRENRQQLLHNKQLQTVISLPAGLFSLPSATASLVIFSTDNEAVRLVDASKYNRRSFRLGATQEIDTVVSLLQQDAENSCLLKAEEIVKNSYNWLPRQYMVAEEVHVPNGVPFRQAIISMQRGYTIPRRILEDIISIQPTPYRYLRLQDLQNGQIQEDMPYVTELNREMERAILSTNDLILTRNEPFKAAVFKDNQKEQVVANGNIFYLQLDKKQFLPTYVMLYLNSPQGQRQLDSKAVGNIVKSLSRKELENLEIPLRPMAEQEAIVKQYEEYQNQLNELKKQEEEIYAKVKQLV